MVRRLFIPSGARGTYARICLLHKRFIVAVFLALIVSSCALYQRYEASKPETVRKTEAMLAEAGFTTIKVVTDDEGGLVEDLPPDEIRKYTAQSGAVYWYYDPDICVCVYEGHQSDYDSYQMAQRQESDTAQYAAESGDQQVAQLNALNGAFFPPPILWIGGFAPAPHFGGGFHGGFHGGEGHFGGHGGFGAGGAHGGGGGGGHR
jgi:hypothetical protein